jgi:hypothetical protein
VGFAFTAERGTGVLESRFVVYCALRDDVFAKCLDVMTDRALTVAGYPPDDSMAAGIVMNQRATVAVRGDSVLVERSAVFKKYGGEDSTSVSLGRAVLLLPPVRRE